MLKLLFTCGHWHGLAKLRQHTDDTLDLLDIETRHIGKELRAFISKTCGFYDTRELRREADARKRRKAKKNAGASGATQGRARAEPPQMDPDASTEVDEPTPKKLNINTYKAHSLGDYAQTIRRLGTTDSYSTVIVRDYPILGLTTGLILSQGELEHRRPKARFSRTDKKDFIKQMTRIERRETRLRRIRAKLGMPARSRNVNSTGSKALKGHYHIGESENVYQHIGTFLRNNAGDPAIKVCLFYAAVRILAKTAHRITCRS